MTSPKQETDEPERIWLEPRCCADPHTGRQWCEDNVWPTGDCPDDTPATEYVLADRIEHLQSENERKDAEIEALRMALDLARARECRCPKPLPPGCYGSAALTKDQQQ